ncbi:ABC transporter permease [Falsirhodobacter algicola]|uniref:ABC transporter permease subunit n=1 Tax=Falsirhodobacter algicola TaxID=2692330 RepID=A0A8J8MRT5_9RHOB|nr:ABC transporter permease subunit [Falsirhodobacter algicola]QUS35028.1 ABC transporter permease subunit [Falsirhodobacter algicola]
MFAYCADPKTLEGLNWLSCYLTTGTHLSFYASFLTVLLLLAVTAPVALLFGFAGAMASRSDLAPLRWTGRIYMAMVRGIPDIIFFLFFIIALDQGLEYLAHFLRCDDLSQPVRQGGEFRVCPAAKIPPGNAPQIVHQIYAFVLAVFTFAIVFGAFAANVLAGAMKAVPRAQLETAESFGMTQRQINRRILIPQMWVHALPGLSNLWMILIKATPLLFILGIQDIVYWAQQIGAMKTQTYSYPHPDWRLWYFLGLLVFYLGMTKLSEIALNRILSRVTPGQPKVTT